MAVRFAFGFFLLSPGLIDQVAQSGRCTGLGESPDAKLNREILLAPGPPPLLSFRVYEGRLRGNFGNSGLMLDDAGH